MIISSRHFDILAKTRSWMTTATTFSRQNEAGSRASTTWKCLALVAVLVSESKAFYWKDPGDEVAGFSGSAKKQKGPKINQKKK